MDVKTLIQGVLKASEKPDAILGYARTALDLCEEPPPQAEAFLKRAQACFQIHYDLKPPQNGIFYAVDKKIRTQTPEALGPWLHLSVVAHELTHWSGCLEATARPAMIASEAGALFLVPRPAQYLEECVAEVGALLILERLGWDVLPELHFAYVAQYFGGENLEKLLEAYLPEVLFAAEVGVEWLWQELKLSKEDTNGTDSLSQVA